MPEGDTIHHAANRIRPILEGAVPDEVRTPHPRFGQDRWGGPGGVLTGRHVTGVDAHGKHLFLRFEGDMVLHSHLRMTGSWGTYRAGQRWRRAPRRAWLVLRARDHEVVGIDLVEVAPDYDPTQSTAILAAQVLLNFLGFIFHARGQR